MEAAVPGKPGWRRWLRWILAAFVGAASLCVSFAVSALNQRALGWARGAMHRTLPPLVDTRELPNPNGFDEAVRATSGFEDVMRDELTSGPTEAIDARLAEHRKHLERLRRSFRLSYLTPAIYGIEPENTPYLSRFRLAGRLFAAQSEQRRLDGDVDGALRAAVDELEFGSRIGRGAPLLHGLLGFGMTSQGTIAAEKTLGAMLSPRAAAHESRRVLRITESWPPLADICREEKRLWLSWTRLLFVTTDWDMDPRSLMAGRRSPLSDAEKKRKLEQPTTVSWLRANEYRKMEIAFDSVIAASSHPFSQQGGFSPTSRQAPSIVGDFREESVRYFRHTASLRLLALELALHAYQRRNGSYPDSLEALKPEFLPRIPRDPFTEKAFVYRLSGREYVLYSLGPDKTDLGGIPMTRVHDAKGEPTGEWTPGDLVAGRLDESR